MRTTLAGLGRRAASLIAGLALTAGLLTATAAPASAIPPPDPVGTTSVTVTSTLDGMRHSLKAQDGHIYHREDGPGITWNGRWNALYTATGATRVDATYDPNLGLQVVAVINGFLWHIVRLPNGNWTGWETIYNAPAAQDVSIAVQTNGDAHIAAVIGGRLYHRVRHWAGDWTPWMSYPNYAGSDVSDVDVAVDGENNLQLVAVTSGQIRHTARYQSGAWAGFSLIYSGGAATSVGIAAQAWSPPDGGDSRVVAAVGGRVFVAYRYSNGAWYGGWNGFDVGWVDTGRAGRVTVDITYLYNFLNYFDQNDLSV
ncbi:hypothetical protein Afil01_37380 [Actinorhabdospora filicis]|uniref:Uncharacterized protein n=1 Tax=Actinorhabdospora filicis TaxID=1785913 RepID=A0A9W6SN35_9ACTN|nr:hypothetical protein [Actinorhabdospora filicis]GLZ78931.1 hypothetical protein Afil01_37380 [Actinorhabdospora filicis]